MEEEKKYVYAGDDLVTVKLDFKKLAKWRKNDDVGRPVCCFFDVYEACELGEHFDKYNKDTGNQIVAADNLLCNFYTIQRLKNFIEENWKTYSLIIDGDNQVSWDPNSKYGKKKHYAKKLKAKARNAVLLDFMNFCPGLDDELPDNTLVFRVYRKEEGHGDTDGD